MKPIILCIFKKIILISNKLQELISSTILKVSKQKLRLTIGTII